MITEYCQLLSACTRLLDGVNVVVSHPITKRKVKYNLLPYETMDFDHEKSKFIHTPSRKRPEYLLSHANNPLTLWLLESSRHWVYLRKLAIALYGEYQYRYNKQHAAGELALQLNISQKLSNNGFRPPPCSMPEDCKIHSKDVTVATVDSYRKYYNDHKQHIAKWTKRDTPFWFKENINAKIHY